MYTAEEHLIITKLKSYGIHISKCRVTVFKLFIQHKKALTISFINRYFSGSLDRISVYRVLIFFIQKKILFKIPNPQGEIRYVLSPSYEHDLTINNKQKTYFMCTCCEEIQILNDPFFQQFKLPDSINAHQSYLYIEGLCKSCDR